jgi:uncharacterized protein (DUF4213/DUF364 family)
MRRDTFTPFLLKRDFFLKMKCGSELVVALICKTIPPIMPFDPIRHFYKKIGCQQHLVQEMVIGEKYAAVILMDGRIGVCATLGTEVEKVVPGFSPNLKNPTHRIILNAYFNAMVNYDHDFGESADIFDAIDFSNYKKIVMIGWFRTLHKKFRDARMLVEAYDMLEQNRYLSPIAQMYEAVSEADALVVSSTTIFNETFKELTDATCSNCDIFMLGPSTILHPDIFHHSRVKALFGSIFKPHDKAVLNLIRSGCGTPEFSGHLQKVYLLRPPG